MPPSRKHPPKYKIPLPNSKITFWHPAIGYLDTDYGVNDISWSYNMNVQRYSTYGGEVIQILSVFVEDITIIGQVATYAQMELLFSYFATYMEIASQGNGPVTPQDTNNPAAAIAQTVGNSGSGQGQATDTRYNEFPLNLKYPERGWNFYIQPKDMVGFRYGREQIAPEWEITAAVYDLDPNSTLEDELKQAIATSMVDPTSWGNITASSDDAEFNISGQIGFNPNNPFSNPFPNEGIIGEYNSALTQPYLKNYGTYYNNIVQKYSQNDFSTTTSQFGSGPTL